MFCFLIKLLDILYSIVYLFSGITPSKWSELCTNGVVSDYAEVYRLTYFGGIAQELRHEIWPYLLGHYKFGSTQEQRNELSEETRQA